MKTRILVVDDEEPIRELLSLYLGRYGYDVAAVDTAANALRRVEEEVPGLVILDVVLPDADGMEVLSTLRAARPDLPVVILTGIGSDEDLLQEAQTRGAAGYISKTLPLDQLLLEVRRVLKAEVPRA